MAVPKLAVVAVLPTPPFWLATAIIPAICRADYRGGRPSERPYVAHAGYAVTVGGPEPFIDNVVHSLRFVRAAVLVALLLPATARAAASDTTLFPQTNHSVSFG